ncbi:hypothetical protein TNIN_158261 [Trichonephila inaurata madagascariensis]|uniref:Uncharacterized protein n=1 Tax=Trichonephila inaurata madagascariensis TaxID=2747483 RepID=A0A8X7BRM4_9ARAC|nr:hypothetical protein TNIN_158261 [Trichonephila inaurata madagascariensis]
MAILPFSEASWGLLGSCGGWVVWYRMLRKTPRMKHVATAFSVANVDGSNRRQCLGVLKGVRVLCCRTVFITGCVRRQHVKRMAAVRLFAAGVIDAETNWTRVWREAAIGPFLPKHQIQHRQASGDRAGRDTICRLQALYTNAAWKLGLAYSIHRGLG